MNRTYFYHILVFWEINQWHSQTFLYGNWKMEEWKVNEARERDGHHPDETISVFNLSVLLVSWKYLCHWKKKYEMAQPRNALSSASCMLIYNRSIINYIMWHNKDNNDSTKSEGRAVRRNAFSDCLRCDLIFF